MEQDLMDTMLSYLTRREQDAAPFMVYYAPHAIHQGFLRPGQGPRWQRPAPEPYASKYRNMQPKLAGDTAQVGNGAGKGCHSSCMAVLHTGSIMHACSDPSWPA